MQLLHAIHKDWCKTIIVVSHDMDEIAENCNRAAIFSKGKMVVADTPKRLFDDVKGMENLGLEVPFTAKICEYLQENGIIVDCNYTVDDFVRKTLALLSSKAKGGAENA